MDRGFFDFAADAYIRRHPPSGPCLFEYGATLPDFLATFPPCADYPYLPDVARLEWAMNAALHADDATPIPRTLLAGVAAGDLGRLVLEMDPAVAWLRSDWPIDRIWSANQPSADPGATVDLSAGGVRLEIRRRDDTVALRRLEAAPFGFRSALSLALTLEAAADLALAEEPGFDLNAAMKALLDEALVVGVVLDRPGSPMRAADSRSGAGWSHRLARIPLSFHQLLFRLAIAGLFLRAGLIKLSSWETTLALFRDEYQVPVLSPAVAGVLATTFELGCSTLLIIGLATRVATLPLLAMIGTIQCFVYPSAWPEHLIWSSILLYLLTRGAGAISIDHLIAEARSARACRRPASSPPPGGGA